MPFRQAQQLQPLIRKPKNTCTSNAEDCNKMRRSERGFWKVTRIVSTLLQHLNHLEGILNHLLDHQISKEQTV